MAHSSRSPNLRTWRRQTRKSWRCWTGLAAKPGVILVGTTEHTLGIVTRDELTEARDAGRGSEPLAAIVDETFAHVHPDHSMDIVLERLAESAGLLPVVSRVASRRVLGVIAYEDIASFAKRRADRRVG